MSDYYRESAGPLFDLADAINRRHNAAARTTDPETSHEAARRAPVAGHCRRVLDALAAGPAGQTEIGRRCGLLPHQVNKRLADLARVGLIELTGREVEGGREREWMAIARPVRRRGHQ